MRQSTCQGAVYTAACSFIPQGFCTKHHLCHQHFHYMHVPPLIKAHHLSVLLTGPKKTKAATLGVCSAVLRTSALDIRA